MVTNKYKLAAGSQRQYLAEGVVSEEERTFLSTGMQEWTLVSLELGLLLGVKEEETSLD